MALDDDAFQSLEKDFQQVITELMGDQTLEKFRLEYEKLHKALKTSHESEKRLMSKCRDLNAEIITNSSKVAEALKLSQDDQGAIQQLKQELEKAWKMVDTATDRETKARETIQNLKVEISNLTKLVEQGAGLSMGQESSVNELLQQKDALTQERDELNTEAVSLREQLATLSTAQVKAEADLEEADEKIMELQQELQMKTNEISRETRKKEKVEREIDEKRKELENKGNEIRNLEGQLQRGKDDFLQLEQQLKEQRITHEKAIRDMEMLNIRLTKLQMDYQNQIDAADALAGENHAKQMELKAKEDEIHSMRQETARLNKAREAIQKKLQQTEEAKADIEGQKETLKNKISGLEREVETMKTQGQMDKKACDELTRERDILNKNYVKANNATKKQIDLVKLHERSKKNLELEISQYREEASKQRKIIYQLEKERDRYINEASDLTSKVLAHMEDIKIREMQIFDYKKTIAESETKLKQQQNLYEAVRSDRNLYSKNLIEAQDEITEMKRKLKIMNHQIDQLKEEITSKEAALVKVNLDHTRIEKEKDQLRTELVRMKLQAAESRSQLDMMEKEVGKLQQVIRESDAERKRQMKELDQVISERDILGTQLVRRNDELSLLYEKIKIQQSTLNKGETQYRQRVEDIRILKLEIKKLRREKAILNRSVATQQDLNREVYHTQRELLRERTRCKALEEELENPMNIHRWRKLEGSDPSAYEMIQKVQALQKRLIRKTEEVVDKEMLIQEKEKLYVELKHILARQPGPEVAEQLRIYQETLRTKTKQMKRLASELNMYETQSSEYKYEVERLARELQDVKKKYFQSKKNEQKQREKERAMEQGVAAIIQPQRNDGTRFTGGGFSLKSPQKAA